MRIPCRPAVGEAVAADKTRIVLHTTPAAPSRCRQEFVLTDDTPTYYRIDRLSKIIRRDLEAARFDWVRAGATPVEQAQRAADTDFLRYRDSDGMQADFHSLRHTFLSRLGRAGVSAKVMQ